MIDFFSFLTAVIPALFQAIPVNIAARMLGGSSTYVKAFIITITVNLIALFCNFYLNSWAAVASFFLLIAAYKVGFSVSVLKSFFIWLISLVIGAIIVFLLAFLGFTALSLA